MTALVAIWPDLDFVSREACNRARRGRNEGEGRAAMEFLAFLLLVVAVGIYMLPRRVCDPCRRNHRHRRRYHPRLGNLRFGHHRHHRDGANWTCCDTSSPISRRGCGDCGEATRGRFPCPVATKASSQLVKLLRAVLFARKLLVNGLLDFQQLGV